MSDAHESSCDIRFAVPFTHRLRFTRDVFSADEATLVELFEPSGDRAPRVQFWLDEDVATASPQLRQRLWSFAKRHAERFHTVGNVQMVPGGEAVKNDVHVVERMLKCVNAADLDRRSYIVVIGGGAVLDAVGFAAAISHRGIRLVRLPTTTLAQADSGVGVKNSINLFAKKNWCGTFAVPWAVVNDEQLLSTLPDRDFACGFSEAVKVSLLKDAEFFLRLCKGATAVRKRDAGVYREFIRESAIWHLRHITAGGDPFEALEARPLDFGHWSAHKLEVMTNFELRHGEAVGIGVAIDAVYSSLKFGFPKADACRVLECLRHLGLPLSHAALSRTDELFAGLEEFRQHLGGRLTVTMLKAVGEPIDVHEIDHGLMKVAIDRVRRFAGERERVEV
ncbi:MAG: 3-dehydroquinate synthase [Planctomycetota bacterium]|nr:3-dehydroquinate synthase [Planctomycetaceae bacterium]MDQ3331998.1 3-dehydroquinate synthase [Planctomycetota bacterium]